MSIRVTKKLKPGGITGTERINVEDSDKLKKIWDISLQEISNLNSKLIKIGEVTYEDLNSLGDDTEFEITFSDAKLEDYIFIRGVAKISEEFNSYSYGYSENYISNVVITAVANTPGTLTTFPDSQTQDILTVLTMNSANLQDWTSGVLEIYIEIKRV